MAESRGDRVTARLLETANLSPLRGVNAQNPLQKGLMAFPRSGFDYGTPSVCASDIDVTCPATERFWDKLFRYDLSKQSDVSLS